MEQGTATLLLADGEKQAIAEGEVLRTLPSEVHGVASSGDGLFVYPSVTMPPQNFTPAYPSREGSTGLSGSGAGKP